MSEKAITIPNILSMKAKEKIAVMTAYDYPTAKLIDEAGIEIILVGDSVGVVFSGYENTLKVTTEEMIYHTKAVTRAKKRALVVTDMPFMSYQISEEDALRNAFQIIKEGGGEAVKLEGGTNVANRIKAITNADIPVMAHIGLTPQSVHRMGGFKVQGRKEQAAKIIEDALAVQDAGAFSVVLEGIPQALAKEISEKLSIPTIGIGAGVHCDGQVLVIHDILGLCEKYSPKFVKKYADLAPIIKDATKSYIEEVKLGQFPTEEHSFN